MTSQSVLDTGRSKKRIVAIAVIFAIMISLSGGIGALNADRASAYTGADFEPGNIISDLEFYNGGAMSEAAIQKFLDSKTGILKNLRQNVSTRAKEVSQTTGNLICEEINGGSDLRASTIIYRAQVACGISAKVILVTLQKEQGLITNSNPTSWGINYALGYGCPDDGGCSASYEGFGYQVYTGTRQFKAYKAANFAKQPGVHTISYHPNSSCGSSKVDIKNYATAALYNYTPYRPNTAALNNLGSNGDSCSSYGNRNFWDYYYSWFGNPTNIAPAGIAVERIGGADRYEVAVGLSRSEYGAGVPVLYIATGLVFSDALSAGAAAAHQGGPLLLVRTTKIPSAVRAEIVRLAPDKIVVAGGPASVSSSVYRELAKLAPDIHRESGADRYEVSRNVAAYAFGSNSSGIAYLATGLLFSDALSASAAGGSLGAPVISVRGTDKKIDPKTAQTLVDLGITDVRIAGGSSSVSAGIMRSVAALPGINRVVRFGGADRYVVSEGVNSDAFGSADTAYVASGLVFSDALSGGPIAGVTGSPLYLVGTGCIPRAVLQNFIDMGVKRMVILGGPSTLSSKVAAFKSCS
jgi:putative cell wall-binding protein